MKKNTENGFTLVEILVSILILGLSVSGLLGFLQWGQLAYSNVSDGIRVRSLFCDTRIVLRNLIGKDILSQAAIQTEINKLLPRQGRLKLEKIDVKPYDPGAVFVNVSFFEDRNRNGNFDPGEEKIQRLWCFQTRKET